MIAPDPRTQLIEPDLQRLAVAAHYIIARTEPAQLGATKLNKVLWYSDIEYYRRTGKTITGSKTYVRLSRGPVPHRIENALNLLKNGGKILERTTKVYDYDRREFIWVQQPDISTFTADQIDIMNIFIDLIKVMTAEQISSITHKDAMWTELKNGEPMPISAGSVIPRLPTEEELAWASARTALDN
jgi:hypothetical protein